MKNSILLAAAFASTVGAGALFLACTGDDTSVPSVTDAGAKDSSTPTTDSSTPGTDTGTPGTDTGTGNPAPPTLGAQIDRMGRPAVNTALNHAFDADAGAAGAAKDGYNNAAPGTWGTFAPEIAKNLAILDSLDKGALANDGGGCGNQPFADNDAGANRYATLAGVLAGDALWLNTGSQTCATYLGVELNATGAVPNTDCGGRKLSYDVIDTTYTVVSGTFPTAFGDTIPAVASKTSGTTFPYLAAPQ